MKRVLPARAWLILGIIAIVVVSYMGTFLLAGISELLTQTRPQQPPKEYDMAARKALFARAESQTDHWSDATWQANLIAELERLQLELLLTDGAGRPLLQYPPFGTKGQRIELGPVALIRYSIRPLHEAVIYRDGQVVGRATWGDLRYVLEDTSDHDRQQLIDILIPVSIVLIISSTVWGATSLALRGLMRPLGEIAAAAGKINRGDLDFTVPTSQIRELNDFARAFASMRDGLKESVAKQAELEQERRLFVAAMAHDLRTPLTSVRGYLEGIRDGVARSPEKLEKYVGVALEKTAALERLVDGLFSYSRTEYLNQVPQCEELDLGALLSAAVTASRPRAEANGIALRLEEPPEPLRVRGDALMLNRVVDNLLDNALRHTPAGATVTVGWQAGLEAARFWVQDTGPGIPPEDLDRLFQPLYRADKARGTRTGGAGLGLAIARRLIEAHGGTISVENRDGARFTVSIPLM